jgi:hypothetical protein
VIYFKAFIIMQLSHKLLILNFILYSDIEPLNKQQKRKKTRFRRSRDSSVGLETRLRAGRPRSHGEIPGRGKRFFSPPQRTDRLWGPPSLLIMGTGCCFRGGKAAAE